MSHCLLVIQGFRIGKFDDALAKVFCYLVKDVEIEMVRIVFSFAWAAKGHFTCVTVDDFKLFP